MTEARADASKATPNEATHSAASGPHSREAMRDALVEAALIHAAFDGWSSVTIKVAATDAGIDTGDLTRLLPRGHKSLLDALDDWLDRKMLAACGPDFDGMSVRRKIAFLVRARFEPLEHYKEATRRAVIARGWPAGISDSGQSLWRTVDRIWLKAGFDQGAGDGVSYYTRRAILVGVIGSLCLFWLEDGSENSKDSWRFLNDRINGVLRFGKFQNKLSGAFMRVPGLGGSQPMRRGAGQGA